MIVAKDSVRIAFVDGMHRDELETLFNRGGDPEGLPTAAERSKQVAADPVASAKYFHFMMKCWLEVAIGWSHGDSERATARPIESMYEPAILKALMYYFSIETQQRGHFYHHTCTLVI